jgi:hypothetical protein
VKKLDSTRIWFIVATVIALAVPPLMLRAEPEGIDQIRTRVATMTQTERERFDRNSGEYLNLTDEQRAQYRAMHAELELDKEQNQGRLGQALDDYYAWLLTLQSFPRQELRTTSDPQERITKISTVLEDQSEEQLRDVPWLRRQFERTPSLSSEQLHEMMTALEKSVSYTQDESDRLQPLSGIERYLEFFRILRDRKLGIDQIMDRGETTDRLVAALPGGKLPDWIQGENAADQRKMFLGMVLFTNLRKEHGLEIRRRNPSDEDLESFVRDWPPDKEEDLDRLLEMEPDRFLQSVQWAYVAHNNSKLDFNVVPQVLWGTDWWQRGNGSRPQFDGERQRGQDGDERNRGFDDHRGDRRPRGDREGAGGDRPD